MTLVIDSGLVAAALIDSGPTGTWADQLLGSDDLAAPQLMQVEVVNVLRRAVLAGEVSADAATMAHADLLDLPVELFGYEPCAARIWQLRANLAAYDAWYVALAESLGARLATLDLRLSRANGPRCELVTPPSPA